MTLPIHLDSWWEPTDAQLAAAKANGIAGWLGYFSNGSDRIYHGWADATFRRVQAHGLWTAAFCSGWADPGWIRSRAAALGIPAILDVETSIRASGGWVDGWLAASGAALYGSQSDVTAHLRCNHPGYVIAAYPGGDPGSAWPIASVPSQPHGWQYAGSTTFGWLGSQSVDRSHYSPGWAGTAPPAPPPPPSPPQEFDVANLTKTSGTVVIGSDGRGWFDLPSGVGNVVSVTVYSQDPQSLGHYAAVPAFAGIAWPPGKPGRLVFGTGPDGQAPAGAYGFDCWYVS